MATNEYVNKVQFGDQTIIDISDTTAEAGDVIQGQTFYTRSGAPATGSLGDATQSTHGLMSASDKIKIDTITDQIKTINTSAAIQIFTDGGNNLPMNISVAINPVQDLHGYDFPFPAGYKNLINPTGTTEEVNGLTFTKDAYGQWIIKGTASSLVAKLLGTASLKANTEYLLSGCPEGGSGTSSYRLDLRTNASSLYNSLYDTGSGRKFTPNEDITLYVYARFASGYACPSGGLLFKPMIRLFSISDGTFLPYSNICPITGWTGANVTVSPTSSPDDPDKEVYTITFPQAAGTVYGGTVKVNQDGTGELVVDREYLEFDGSDDEQWAVVTGTYNYFRLYLPNSNYVNSDSSTKEKSNSLNWTGSLAATNQGIGIRIVNNRDLRLRYVIDNTLTVSDLQTYLASNPIQVVVELLTTVSYDLTPGQVKTLLGVNNILADTGDIESITYYPEVSGLLSSADKAKLDLIEAGAQVNPSNATTSAAGLMSTTDKIKLDSIEEIDPYETINTPAPLIHLTDAAEAPIKEMEIEINLVQDFNGYDHPWVGGTQKNLFPKASVGGTKRIEVNNLNIPAGTYTFGAKVTSTDTDQDYCLILFYHDNTQVAYLRATRSSGGSRYTETVTFSDTVTKIQFYASGGWDESDGDTFSFSNIQLEAGSTATIYESYENVCPISGWNTINIYDTKFNCYPEEWISDGHGINSAGEISTADNVTAIRTDFFPVKAGVTYYYNFPEITTWGQYYNNIFWYDHNYTFISTEYENSSFAVTAPSNAMYAKLSTTRIYNSSSGTYNNDICLNVYDETRNGEYEAYQQGYEYEISLPETVYGGKLTVYGDGSGELVSNYNLVTLNGQENATWVWYNNTDYFYTQTSFIPGRKQTNNSKIKGICNYVITDSDGTINLAYLNTSNTNGDKLQLHLPLITSWGLSSESTSEEINAKFAELYAAGKPLQIVYELETPITYQLTFPQVQTLLSENNIWANSGNINKIIYVKKDIDGLISGTDKAIIDRLVSNNPQYKYWKDDGTWDSPIVILEYGVSTWNEFIDAYNKNKDIYCKISSGDGCRIGHFDYYYYGSFDAYAQFNYLRSPESNNSANEIYKYRLYYNTNTWGTVVKEVSAVTMTGATSNAAGTAGLVPAPATTDVDKFLAGDGTYKSGGLPMVVLSYGSSTWQDFINAYNNNVIVYCRASSNSNPASGSQTRMAFMAYVNNATNPTSVEFQYYRSVSSHSATQMGDQVFVYTLTNASGGTWSVTSREASIKEIKIDSSSAGSVSWSSNKVTLTSGLPAVTSSDNGKILKVVDGAWAAVSPE